MNQKDNIWKFAFFLSILIILILLILLISRDNYCHPTVNKEVYSISDDTFIKNGNSYKIKFPINSLFLENLWLNKSIDMRVYLYDEYFNLIEEYNTSQINISKEGKFYLKKETRVHFKEGGEEIRYTWFLFEIDPNSKDLVSIPINSAPALWIEEPELNW